jgi:hypothetical protein
VVNGLEFADDSFVVIAFVVAAVVVVSVVGP